MSARETVCAVVVTFNRKQLLLECLEGLKRQTRALEAIYIIDNFSSDGTPELLLNTGFIAELPPASLREPWESTLSIQNVADGSPLVVHYVRMHENTGGAGGFHEGVKRAYEKGYDWLWLMDDDGLPNLNCLEVLISKSTHGNFLAPLVINIDKKDEMSFGLGKGLMTITECKNAAKNGVIKNVANPFNGVLISNKLVKEIGFPKKELFIWGDEVEYQIRAINSNMGVYTVVDAVHFHPKDRVRQARIPLTKYKVNYQDDNPLRNYCIIRNQAYINYHYNKKGLIKSFIKHSAFFILRFDFVGYLFYFRAIKDGILGIWGGEKNFLQNSG